MAYDYEYQRGRYGQGSYGRNENEPYERNYGGGYGESSYRGYGGSYNEPYNRSYGGSYNEPYYRGSGYGTYYNEPYRSQYYNSYYNEPSGGYDYGRSNYGGSYGSNYGGNYGASRQGYGYEGRYSEPYNRNKWDRGYEERGFLERAGDEVRSWFGDEEAERRRQMDEMRSRQHAGRGPRNYRRSDERIREDVNERLTDDPYLDASNIEVAVENTVVTLTGTVEGRTDKRRAESLAEAVRGVTDVNNQLRVSQTGQTETTTSTTETTGTTGTTRYRAART